MKKIRLLVILSFIMGCLLMLASCGSKTLSTPDNFQVNETTLELTWTPIQGAKGYKILVNGEEYRNSKPRYPLEPLNAGEYTITVQAVGDGEATKDSAWSEDFVYNRAQEGVSYRLINNNTEYEVIGIGKAVGNIVIDDVYRGKPVTKIGDMAFANKSKDVLSVKIGKNVRSIGSRAFYNCALMSTVEIPESVTSIGAYAFYGCRSLMSVTLPEGLEAIPNYAFASCRKLESVNIHNNIETIGEHAFASCDMLNNIVISDSVTSIGEYAFSENVALTNLKVGKGLETISKYAFLGCVNLTELTLSDGLKTIDEYAFSGCSSLQALDVPDSVQTIALGAFINCKKLVTIDLSENLAKLGNGAFMNTPATGYFEVTLEDGSVTAAQLQGLFTIDGWIVSYVGELTEQMILDAFAENPVGIADSVFYECDKAWDSSGWSLTLPDSLRHVGDQAFYNCTKLNTLLIGSGMKRIGKYAFAHSNISTISFKEGLEVIDNYAFQSCSRLKKVLDATGTVRGDYLPQTLKRIGTYAFEATNFWDTSINLVFVADWLVGCVNASLQTADLVSGPEAPESLRGIADYAFYGAMGLNKVVIPDTVQNIGRCAFYNCGSLLEVALPSGIEKIEEFTFYQCMSLTQVYIPRTVQSIGYSAFNKCYSLAEVYIPLSVTSIDQFAFYKCMSLTKITFETEYTYSVYDEETETNTDVTINGGVESINNRAFYGCAALIELTLPSTLRELGTHVFYKCTGLTTLTIEEGIEEINNYNFYGCESLTTVNLPNSLVKIGNYAFRNCAAISEVTFGNSLQEIGRYAFYGAAALETVQFPASVTKLDDYAFRNCAGLKSVVLPSTITTINKHAFNGCNNATFYTEYSAKPADWLGQWNSSYRPVFWGCTLSSDKTYVVSFVKTATSLINPGAINGISAPMRAGYEFGGWATESGSTSVAYTMENVATAPNGTTLFAIWNPMSAE